MAPKAKRDGEAQYIIKGIDRRLWARVRAAAASKGTTVKAVIMDHLIHFAYETEAERARVVAGAIKGKP